MILQTTKYTTTVALLWAMALAGATANLWGAGAEEAARILATAGVRGGLVVHAGCAEGEIAAAFRIGDAFFVHGLDTDAAKIAKARELFRTLGLSGKVTADAFDGENLPYVDNMVNLLVWSGPCEASNEEMLRVLAPRGVAMLSNKEKIPRAKQLTELGAKVEIKGVWLVCTKPVPEETDEWTHYLHDADNNAVAQDTVVGPPKHYQWIGSPRYLRHHDYISGFSAMVSAEGRIFKIVDLGPRWSVQMPAKWTLMARDAFNGVVLWQRPIEKWHAHLWPLKKGPADLMRRLVAKGGAVYVTPGVGEPVLALDAVTGDTVRTYKGTEGAEEIILAGGVLHVLVNPELDAYKTLSRESVEATRGAGRDWNWDERPRRLKAFDAATGRKLWDKESRVAPVTMTSAGGRFFFHDGDKVVCLDARTGDGLWTSKAIPRWKPMHVLFGPSLVAHRDVVIFAGGEEMDPLRGGKDTMTALSAKTGETLWTAPHPRSGYASAEDLLIVNDLVWCGDTTNRSFSGVMTGRDLHTGEIKNEFPPDDWQPHMPHHRCYRAKATTNYLLLSRTGIEFVDFREKHWTAHHWVRGSCNYGIMPCNGLLYAPPHSCACYPLAKLTGFNALAPERKTKEKEQRKKSKGKGEKEKNRLEKGPAYGKSNFHPSLVRRSLGEDVSFILHPSNSWPTFRHDAARGGSTKASVSADLKRVWQTDVGGKLSALTVAHDKVFVAEVDGHTVHALDAATGKPAWRFAAGGRVDSPPTVWQGHAIFGSNDGFVYCLRADDGTLAWRFRAAPEDRRLMSYEQLESVWPVSGSVLVREGVVYCVAGRSMWLDGGMRLLRLDARTGRLLSETVLDDKYPGTDDNLQTDVKWPNLPVALPDVLSSDGNRIYMRSQPFDLDGKRLEVITPRDYKEQQGETAHLFSPTGFLDDSWWHRTYWLFGRSFVGGAGGWHLAAYQAPSGRILVTDESCVYGFGRAPLTVKGTPNTYHLFASDKEPEFANPYPNWKPGKGSRVKPTRLQYHWSVTVPFLARALVATDRTIFAAGPPAVADETEVYMRHGAAEIQAKMKEQIDAFEGRKGGLLMAVSKAGGEKLSAYRLDSAPVFDGLAAAGGRLFMSALDGKVLCLGPGRGDPLEPAPEVKPEPLSAKRPDVGITLSHPDFQYLTSLKVAKSDLGYRLKTERQKTGLAMRKLPEPLAGRVEFRVKIRPRPGMKPGTPGNGFLAFGDGPADDRTVKCGFRISGQRLYIVQGPLSGGSSKSAPVKVTADRISELHVVVDLTNQKVTATMNGQTLEASLERRLDTVAWVGYCVNSVDADFSPIEIDGS